MKSLKSFSHQFIDKVEENRPIINNQKCENCDRCINHCPYHELSLSKNIKVIKLAILVGVRGIEIEHKK
ncbi:4Fe-4S dicluster domain-containing protein [Enterococcus avium]